RSPRKPLAWLRQKRQAPRRLSAPCGGRSCLPCAGDRERSVDLSWLPPIVFCWEGNICPHSGIKRAESWKTTRDGVDPGRRRDKAVTKPSDRIPGENVGGPVELVERSLERRHAVL